MSMKGRPHTQTALGGLGRNALSTRRFRLSATGCEKSALGRVTHEPVQPGSTLELSGQSARSLQMAAGLLQP